jgi:hypothetical protein
VVEEEEEVVEETETEEETSSEPACYFLLLAVADVTITSEQMMTGDLDFDTMISSEPTCVTDTSSVNAGCYNEYSAGVNAAMILAQVDLSGSEVTVFMSSTSFGELCLGYDSGLGFLVASEPFTVTIEDPVPEVVEEETTTEEESTETTDDSGSDTTDEVTTC